jgi:HSP20 family protein
VFVRENINTYMSNNQVTKYNGLNSDLIGLVDSFHDAFWNDPFFQLSRNWRPTDISETDNDYKIEIELPRFKRDEIRVEAAKGVLRVTAKNAKANYVREFGLPYANLNESDIKLADGVLTISVPKSGEGQTKQLQIK